jgi:hypothetical protein
MFEFVQEHSLPRLSSTSIFQLFDDTSNIKANIIAILQKGPELKIEPDSIPDILAIIGIKGSAIAKEAIKAYRNNEIVILFSPTETEIPMNLPFIVHDKGDPRVYIFADKVVSDINSNNESPKLMAILEAAYLALVLHNYPQKFLNNRSLMLALAQIYTRMVVAPLENKLYMKDDNLNKAILYSAAYFYRMIDGDNFELGPVITKKIVSDPVDKSVLNQITEEVKAIDGMKFEDLLKLIARINPVRYAGLEKMYANHFTMVSGGSLMFALENLGYLFILISSAAYKTALTGFSLNKMVASYAKNVVAMITSTI